MHKRLIGIFVSLLVLTSLLDWWAPSWYNDDVGHLLLGVLFMLLFFSLASALFEGPGGSMRTSRSSRH
jgi:predicted permease